MKADFRPSMRRVEAAIAPPPAAPEPAPTAVLEALLQRLAVRKDDAPQPRPARWEFVPERDANNLIVKIVATPYY